MKIFERELSARERSAGVATTSLPTPRPKTGRNTPATLVSGSPPVNCVYCNQPHFSDQCEKVKTPADRRQILRDTGRCFVCLRRRHVSRDCRSSIRCSRCNGRHHTSLCASTSPQQDQFNPQPCMLELVPRSCYRRPKWCHPTLTYSNEARAILDLGSKRSYITTNLREALGLKTLLSETIVIKTFGATQGISTTLSIHRYRELTIDRLQLLLKHRSEEGPSWGYCY